MAKNPFIATNYPGYDYTDSNIASVTGGASTLPPDLLSSTSINLREALAGQLPQDTIDLIRQKAAEFGVGRGVPGSELAANQGLRTLGLTSLDQKNRATQSLLPFYISPLQFQQMQQRNASGVGYSGMPTEFRGTVTPPVQQPRGGGGPPGLPTGAMPTTKTGNIGDELVKYLSGGGMAPMGSGTQPTYNSYNPFAQAGPGGAPEGDFSSMVPFLGTAGTPMLPWNFDTSEEAQLSNLADLGIADPSWAYSGGEDLGGA